jgi:hypothetical protein
MAADFPQQIRAGAARQCRPWQGVKCLKSAPAKPPAPPPRRQANHDKTRPPPSATTITTYCATQLFSQLQILTQIGVFQHHQTPKRCLSTPPSPGQLLHQTSRMTGLKLTVDNHVSGQADPLASGFVDSAHPPTRHHPIITCKALRSHLSTNRLWPNQQCCIALCLLYRCTGSSAWVIVHHNSAHFSNW